MFSFRSLAARIIDRARGELEADLRARNYPETAPIPMAQWLAQLGPVVPLPQDEPDTPMGDRPEDEGWEDFEDFDRRR